MSTNTKEFLKEGGDLHLVHENEQPKVGSKYMQMLEETGLIVEMADTLEAWEPRNNSYEKGKEYFDHKTNETGIFCELALKGNDHEGDSNVIGIPLGLPSRGISQIMEYYKVPKKISDIVVSGYKMIPKTHFSSEYSLKIIDEGSTYIMYPLDQIDMEEIITEKERKLRIEYLENNKISFYDTGEPGLHTHDNKGPYGGGKIYIQDHKDEYGNFMEGLEETFSIVPYRTYIGNHNRTGAIEIPITEKMINNIEFVTEDGSVRPYTPLSLYKEKGFDSMEEYNEYLQKID